MKQCVGFGIEVREWAQKTRDPQEPTKTKTNRRPGKHALPPTFLTRECDQLLSKVVTKPRPASWKTKFSWTSWRNSPLFTNPSVTLPRLHYESSLHSWGHRKETHPLTPTPASHVTGFGKSLVVTIREGADLLETDWTLLTRALGNVGSIRKFHPLLTF